MFFAYLQSIKNKLDRQVIFLTSTKLQIRQLVNQQTKKKKHRIKIGILI